MRMSQPLVSTRRNFLTSSALTVVAGCTRTTAESQVSDDGQSEAPDPAGTDPANSDPAVARSLQAPLGVALLGLGAYSSERLAPGLQFTKHCNLVGIVTGTPSKIPTWREQYGIKEGNVYNYETLPSIASNPEIHVVYVVTPTALHARYAIAAAEAGKHVWLEKPMAMTAAECQSVIDACSNNGVSLSIGYRMQHEPNTQTVMQYAKSKPYGPIQSVEALAGFAGGGDMGWRMVKAMGGGALYDMGVYSINALRYATGEEPTRVVRAEQSVQRPDLFEEVDETTEFELEFPSGIVGHGKTSFGEEMNKLTVECERGSYYLEPMQSYEGVQGETSDGVKLDKTVEHQQARQMDDDALAILEGRAPLVPGEEGWRDIRILEAIVESARSGQPVALG